MKKHAPATSRNRDAIADVLARELPETGLVLEVASGSGEHAVFFADRFAGLEWQPSDPDPEALASIAAWRAEEGGANLRAPIALDVAQPDEWRVEPRPVGIVCINMVHIAPWDAALGLFAGAGKLLEPGAPLVLYGPYRESGVPLAPSNASFDESLRARDPRWRLRRVEDMDAAAANHGFACTARHEMPANNLTLTYRRQ